VRKLILWDLISLDGFFEGGKPWDLEWHNYVWGDELERFSLAQLETAGRLLFGRLTYLGMADYWPTAEGDVAEAMNSIPKTVFSKTLERAAWVNTRLVKEEAFGEIERLKRETGKDLFIFGSARLVSALLPRKAIDEIRLGLVPLLLGTGRPLFPGGVARMNFRLLEARPLASGCVILRYQSAPD
jgi:dihydrofolate reductase